MSIKDREKTRSQHYFFRFTVLLSISLLFLSAYAATAEQKELTLKHDGVEREFLLHLPHVPANQSKQSTETTPMPLLIALHGRGGTAKSMIRLTNGRFDELADRDGFMVVYPQGIGRSWNDGRQGSFSKAHRKAVDDTGFIRSLIESLAARYPVDKRRVFVTGISNGGMMAFNLACALNDRIRGIAVVSASLPANLATRCRDGRGVSLALFNGTEDPLIPYKGGPVTTLWRNRGDVLSTDDTVRLWRDRLRCTAASGPQVLPDRADDGTRVTRTDYSACQGGANVVLFRIDGGGHTWPGGRQYLPEMIVGRTSRDINACDEIWKFFQSLK